MYIQNITNAIKEMAVNEIRKFTFKNCCKRVRFSKIPVIKYNDSMKHHKKKIYNCLQLN